MYLYLLLISKYIKKTKDKKKLSKFVSGWYLVLIER